MHLLRIRRPSSDDIEQSTIIGEIDGADFSYKQQMGRVGGVGASQLRRLLGAGYGECLFDLEFEGRLLTSCQIIRDSDTLTFEYEDCHHIGG